MFFCSQCSDKQHAISPQLYRPRSKKRTIYLDALISIFSYNDDSIQKLIHIYKYQSASILQETIVNLILLYLKPITIKLIKSNTDAVTCIPLHKDRLRERTFNQSDLIAKSLSRELRLPYNSQIIRRKIKTKSQAKLDRKHRLKNIRNVFEVNSNYNLQGLNILLFDDVATTLSTLNEGAKVLKEAGAEKVWGMTVARG